MDKREAINIVKAYRHLLKDYLQFDHVYLFGSYAKDTYKDNSDIDVAIVVDRIEGDYFSINPLLWKLRRQIDDRIEPFLIEKEFYEAAFFCGVKKKEIKKK